MEQRKKILRKKCLERDSFTCQKCGLEDLSGKKLEMHHIKPLAFGGEDELENTITLCSSCHKYAPNKEEEFKEYLAFEMDGAATILLKLINEVREKEIFKEAVKEVGDKTSNP